MSKNEKLLIIVESPSKTKTISKYVDNASVIASVGHFKDLPKKDMGIDIDNDFAMQIESMPDKKKFLSQLKKPYLRIGFFLLNFIINTNFL